MGMSASEKVDRNVPKSPVRRVAGPAIVGCSALAVATVVLLLPLLGSGDHPIAVSDHTAAAVAPSAPLVQQTPQPSSSPTASPPAPSAPSDAVPPSASDDGGDRSGSGDPSQGTSAHAPPGEDPPVIITLPPVHIDPPYEPPYTDADAQAAVVNAYGAVPVYGNCYPANSGTWGRTSSPPAPDWGGRLGYEAGASDSGDGGWVQYYSCD